MNVLILSDGDRFNKLKVMTVKSNLEKKLQSDWSELIHAVSQKHY